MPLSRWLLQVLLLAPPALGLSQAQRQVPRATAAAAEPVAQIGILAAGEVQRLPLSYVRSWPVWTPTVRPDGALSLARVPDESDGGGFVGPTSADTLWLPSDLPSPVLRAALGAVVRDGEVRQIFPSVIVEAGGALDEPSRAALARRFGGAAADAAAAWRNFGLCSVPRARTWSDFRAAGTMNWSDLPRLHVLGRSADGGRDGGGADGASGGGYRSLLPDGPGGGGDGGLAIDGALTRLIETLASLDGDVAAQVASGFHIIDVPIAGAPPLDLAPLELAPAAGDAAAADGEGTSRLRAFFARAGDNPRALMERGWPLEMDGCAELDVTVARIGAAGSSEYLPDCYRPLYGSTCA